MRGRFLADVHHALRHLRRSPGYVAAAVVTFALAIGANSAIFSAVHAVLLRPLPMTEPSRLAVVWQSGGIGGGVVELTYRHLREWTAAGRTFTHASVMASHNWNSVLTGRGAPVRIWFNAVSAGFFDTVGVKPILGRGLQPEDDVANARPVAVLNYNTWVRRFGSDSAIVGKMMTLDGSATEIVGVMPQGFDLPRGAEFWIAAAPTVIGASSPPTAENLDVFGVFYVVGRVRAGLAMSAVHERDRRHRGAARSRQSRTPEMGAARRRDADARLRLRTGARRTAAALDRGRRAPADRVRQRLRPDADAGVAAAARGRDPSRARRGARRHRAAVADRDRDRRDRRRHSRTGVCAAAGAGDRLARAGRSAADRGGRRQRHGGAVHVRDRCRGGARHRLDAAAPGRLGESARGVRG